jgi:hypothetical protein
VVALGEDVVRAAEDVNKALDYMRLLLMEAIEEPDRMTEWPSIRAEVEAAASGFGVEANRAARRFWL